MNNQSPFMCADKVDPEWIEFIENEIRHGATYEQAKVEFDIECGER